MHSWKRGRILIADNDEEVLIALERLFEDHGYDTAVTARQDDLQALSQNLVDLLVLDDDLSGAGCVEVLTDLQHSSPRTPPTIVTYHQPPSRKVREQLSFLGVDAVINKCSHAQLVEIARHLLEHRPQSEFDCMT